MKIENMKEDGLLLRGFMEFFGQNVPKEAKDTALFAIFEKKKSIM